MIGIDQAPVLAIDAPSSVATPPTRLRLRKLASRSRYLTIGLSILGTIVLASLIGPMLSPYDASTQDWNNILAAPSLQHPLGTDDLGRDELTRLLVGARLSLVIAFSVASAHRSSARR